MGGTKSLGAANLAESDSTTTSSGRRLALQLCAERSQRVECAREVSTPNSPAIREGVFLDIYAGEGSQEALDCGVGLGQ